MSGDVQRLQFSRIVSGNRLKKHFFTILIVGAAIAFLVRLGVSWELARYQDGLNPVFRPHSATDMSTYRILAAQIAEGSYKGEFYYQPFYYAVFLPAIRIIFGESVWAVIIIQAILGAVTVYFAALCAAILWSRLAGLIALAAIAFSEMLILYTPFHLNETLQSFLLVLLFYFCLRAIRTHNILYWIAAGWMTGFSILTRGNTWFLAPGILAAAIFQVRMRRRVPSSVNKGWSRVLMVSALFLIALIIPQIPFVWRNSMIHGRFTGPSTGAGPNLAIGNTPEAPPGGRNPDLTAGPTEYPPTYESWTEAGNEISVSARIREWAFSEPLAFLELTFRKLLLFWDHREIPDNISRLGEGSWSLLLKIGGFIRTAFIIPPAIAGMILLTGRSFKKHDLKMLLLYYFVISYWLGISIFFIVARFRVPLIPLLCIFAAIFVDLFLRLRRKHLRRAYTTCGLALAVGVFICFRAYHFYQDHLEVAVMRTVRPEGVRVELSPAKTMLLDNGPFTFGGWTTLPLNENTTLKKLFAGWTDSSARSVELELPLFFNSAGSATFLINGERKVIEAASPGSVIQKIPIGASADHAVTIKLLSSSSEVLCIMDLQRNYGRTLLAGQKMSGELVCRLFLAR